jgi:hypothetical protein
MIMNAAGLGTENNCAGEVQQQFTARAQSELN